MDGQSDSAFGLYFGEMGAYIVDSMFGEAAIKGIITKWEMQIQTSSNAAGLKTKSIETGSTFFHVPEDIRSCLGKKEPEQYYLLQ